MYQNDSDFKKTALRIGASLLLFIVFFYTLIGAFYPLFEEILIEGLGDSVGNTASQIIYGFSYLAVFMIPAFFYNFLSRKNSDKTETKYLLSFPDTVVTVIAAISIIFASAYINSWLAAIFSLADEIMPEDTPTTLVGFLLLTFTIAIVPAVCEEFLFRRTILRALLPYGEGFAIISSAIMFGIMHQHILQVFYATMAGIVLGFIYAKTRSYLCVFLIHFTNNFISVIQGAISTNMTEPYASFISVSLTATVFVLGAISLVILMLKENNKKDVYDTGSFEKILLPDENHIKKPTSFNCVRKLFLSPCVLIFTIICISLCILTAFI